MTQQMARVGIEAAELALISGDLAKLTPDQRVSFYNRVCESLGLNPLTQPFSYITLNGKLTLYARKDAADQLRRVHGVSIGKPDIRFEDDWILVTISASTADGRTDSDVGAVSRKDMRGDFGNALMKAVTKAKRRVTLSVCGLGMLDETEVETIPDARPHLEEPTRPALPANGKPGGQHETPGPEAEEQFARFRQAMKDCQTREEVRTVGQLVKATKGKLSPVHVELLRADAEKRLEVIDAATDAAEAAAVAADNSDIPVG